LTGFQTTCLATR